MSVSPLLQVLQKGPVSSVEEFFDVFTGLFNLIDIETNSFRGDCKVSEDVKLHVIQCVNIIADYLNEDMVKEFLSKPSLYPILGHSIHVLLNIGLKEKYKELQTTAIVCLNRLIAKFDFDQSVDKGPVPADILASFLPGISIAVMKIILSDDKLPQRIYIECLKSLETMVKAILPKTVYTYTEKSPDFVVKRTKEWMSTSCSKLDIVFEKIIKALLIKQSTLIKMKLLNFSQELIYVFVDLDVKEETLITLLEVPMVMATYSDSDIQLAAQLWLRDFSSETLIHKHKLRDSLLERLYQLLTTITRETQCLSEDAKVAKFKVIEGYIICLGPHGLSTFMASQYCLDRILTSLISCALLDEKKSTQGYKLIEMLDLNATEIRIPSSNYPVKSFKYFESLEIQQSIERICSLLGQYLNSFNLIDYFSNILPDGSKDPTIIFISNYTIQGIEEMTILDGLFHEYINQLSSLTEYSQSGATSTLALSLLMEGLTILASKYGPPKQYTILLNSLYLILAHTGSDKIVLSDSASTTLQRLADTFGYSSIKTLISENIDYILNYLNVKLKNFESNRQVCPVVYAIINLTGLNILPFTEFTIDNVLASLDIYYNLKCDVLVDLLKIIVSFIEKDLVQQKNPPMDAYSSDKSNEKLKEQFIQQLKEFLEARAIVDSLDPPEMECENVSHPKDNEEEEEEEKDEEKKKLPVEINITIKILERCCHLLSNSSIDIQIVSMEIIMKGLRILEPWEDEILPLAHKLWTPIIKRFNTSNLILLTKCYHCLIVMSQCCGDFLKSRTLEQVIPRLILFLRSQYHSSHFKTDSSPYKHTLEYKLQCEILSTIGLICDYLKIESICLWPVIEAVIPYLTKNQPRSLQEEALKSCRCFLYLDPFAFNSYIKQMVESKSDTERANYNTNLKFLSNIKL